MGRSRNLADRGLLELELGRVEMELPFARMELELSKGSGCGPPFGDPIQFQSDCRSGSTRALFLMPALIWMAVSMH